MRVSTCWVGLLVGRPRDLAGRPRDFCPIYDTVGHAYKPYHAPKLLMGGRSIIDGLPPPSSQTKYYSHPLLVAKPYNIVSPLLSFKPDIMASPLLSATILPT
jgi:hypothetical protein